MFHVCECLRDKCACMLLLALKFLLSFILLLFALMLEDLGHGMELKFKYVVAEDRVMFPHRCR